MNMFEKMFQKKSSSVEESKAEEKPKPGASFSTVKRNWDNPTDEQKEMERLHDDINSKFN